MLCLIFLTCVIATKATYIAQGPVFPPRHPLGPVWFPPRARLLHPQQVVPGIQPPSSASQIPKGIRKVSAPTAKLPQNIHNSSPPQPPPVGPVQPPQLLPRTVYSAAWALWSQYTPCTASCGGGIQIRHRECLLTKTQFTEKAAGGGYGPQACAGATVQLLPCNQQQCVVVGGWSEWSSYTPCCSGLKIRHRTCTNPAPLNAPQCDGPAVDVVSCPASEDVCGCPETCALKVDIPVQPAGYGPNHQMPKYGIPYTNNQGQHGLVANLQDDSGLASQPSPPLILSGGAVYSGVKSPDGVAHIGDKSGENYKGNGVGAVYGDVEQDNVYNGGDGGTVYIGDRGSTANTNQGVDPGQFPQHTGVSSSSSLVTALVSGGNTRNILYTGPDGPVVNNVQVPGGKGGNVYTGPNVQGNQHGQQGAHSGGKLVVNDVQPGLVGGDVYVNDVQPGLVGRDVYVNDVQPGLVGGDANVNDVQPGLVGGDVYDGAASGGHGQGRMLVVAHPQQQPMDRSYYGDGV